MNEAFAMRPGDTFVADECGCSFTVESGPNDTSMVKQAPRCCCGHEMRKEGGGGTNRNFDSETGMSMASASNHGGREDMPRTMPD